MPARKKPQSARQKAIAKGVAAGLTPGQAYYRYRLGSKLKTGRTVQEARGHAGPGSRERTTTKQRSKVAKELGHRLEGPIRKRKRVIRDGDKATYQNVWILSHLTNAQCRIAFDDEILPWAKNFRKRNADMTFRFVYIGAPVYVGGDYRNRKWSDEWSTVGKDCTYLSDHFDDLEQSVTKFLAVYFAKLGAYVRYE